MKHTCPPASFFQRNRDAFIAQMRPASAAVFRAAPRVRKNADEDHKYEPDSDFFYLTGIEAPLAGLTCIRARRPAPTPCSSRSQIPRSRSGPASG
jgi:hypothetical protein